MANSKQYGIEYLRFILAAAVVLFHYLYFGPLTGRIAGDVQPGSWLEYGRFAVYAFFIVSGYVISMSAAGKTWDAFFASRFSRLFPGMAACSLITLMAIGFDNKGIASDDFRSFVMAATLVPLMFGGDLLDGSYWSIVYELRFYLMVMLLILLGGYDRLAVVLTALTALGFALAESGLSLGLGNLLLYPYGGYFVIGVLLFQFKSGPLNPAYVVMFVINFALAVLGTWRASRQIDMFDGVRMSVWAVVTIVLVCVLLFVISNSVRLSPRHARLATFLGGLSYPLYLLHQEVGYSVINWAGAMIGSQFAAIFAIGVSLALATVVYLFVEKKGSRRLRNALMQLFGNISRKARQA